jgi:hypothetical protein
LLSGLIQPFQQPGKVILQPTACAKRAFGSSKCATAFLKCAAHPSVFIDRGQLPLLPLLGGALMASKLNHPGQLALMHALVRFAHITAEVRERHSQNRCHCERLRQLHHPRFDAGTR